MKTTKQLSNVRHKLAKYLDAWFDGLGFIALSRITGIRFSNIDKFDHDVALAWRRWSEKAVAERLQAYEEHSFTDHLAYNQMEFIKSLKSNDKSRKQTLPQANAA